MVWRYIEYTITPVPISNAVSQPIGRSWAIPESHRSMPTASTTTAGIIPIVLRRAAR
jgi:hypothetical protein